MFSFIKNKYLKIPFFLITIFQPFLLVSCLSSNLESESEIRASLKTSWWVSKTSNDDILKYQKNFAKELAALKKANPRFQNLKNFTLKIENASDNDLVTLDRINAQQSDFAIVNASLLSNDNYRYNTSFAKPYFMTLTQAFFNDTQFLYWSPNNDYYFQKMNNQINNFLKNHNFRLSHSEVASKEQLNWDGAKYLKYYNLDQKVKWYRGMIMIVGTEKQRKKIREAWDNRDFDTFKNFGIATKKTTSQGGYILQNKFLQKHFGKEIDLGNFLNNLKVLKTGSDPTTIGDDNNYHIYFDDANSFAWTKQDKEKFVPEILNENGRQINQNFAIEILSYTDPYLYDLGVFSNRFSDLEKELIYLTLQKLSEKGIDNFGVYSGYNGYQKINDLDREIYQPYEKIFKSS